MPRTRKKLCILLPSHWSSNAGGAELQVKALIERLVTLNTFDIHYVARKINSDYATADFALHQIPARRAIAGSFVLDSTAVLRLLTAIRPDVIYQRVGCVYTGLSAYYSRKHDCRMIWHVSSDRDLIPLPWTFSWQSPVRKINKAFIDYGARHAHVIVTQNLQQRALLERNYCRADAIPIANFHPRPTEQPVKATDELTVCWIGNIKKIKRPEEFLRLAMDFAQIPHMKFVMAGTPQLSAEETHVFRQSVDKLPNLRYLGALPHDAVNELLSTAHILVNTSLMEGFPNTFIQAWLRQVAVVSLAVNPDGVFDGDKLGLFAHGQYTELRTKLALLSADRPFMREIGSRAAAYAQEHFSEGNIEKLSNLMD